MKKSNISYPFSPFSTVVVRAPLFSLDDFFRIAGACKDLQQLQRFGEELYADDTFREALYLASPVLFEQWCRMYRENKTDEHILKGVLKYYIRATNRCVPFGLFAGCGTAQLGDNTTLVMPEGDGYIRRSSLDMHFLTTLVDTLRGDRIIMKYAKYYPNNSMYNVGAKKRYVEGTYRNYERVYNLVSIGNNEYIEMLVQAAADGVQFKALQQVLTQDDVSEEDADSFITALIDAQVLVSEVDVPVTKNPREHFTDLLNGYRSIADENDALYIGNFISKLDVLGEGLDTLDKQKIGDNKAIYEAINAGAADFGIGYKPNYLINSNLYYDLGNAAIDKQLISDIQKGVDILSRLTPDISQINWGATSNLTAFKQAFTKKFEGREVPLLLALDNEIGVGYLQHFNNMANYSSLIDDLTWPAKEKKDKQEIGWLKELHSFWVKRYIRSVEKNEQVIELTDEELSAFPSKTADGADTFPVMLSLLEEETGTSILFQSAGATSAANYISRFALENEEICSLIKEIVQAEDENNPEAIIAEVIHAAQSRASNVLMRPGVRSYEIPYIQCIVDNTKKAIRLSEIGVSVKGDTVYLRSYKYNKQVIPEVASAYNYHYNSLPVYHFLCDLQTQRRMTSFYIDTGHAFRDVVFFPRVVYKNIVFSAARWRLNTDDCGELMAAKGAERVIKMEDLRKQLKMPRYITLGVSQDNDFLLDLENQFMIEILVDEMKKRKRVTVNEYFKGNSPLKSRRGDVNFANQLIFSFHKNIVNTRKPRFNGEVNMEVKRKFVPGDEWLYFKLYTGVKSADDILINTIAPLVSALEEKQVISKWFFIRYNDPDPHIRIRFLTGQEHAQEVITGMYAAISEYVENDVIWKVQQDTYDRELERYGSTCIEEAESIFCCDSDAVLQTLVHLKNNADGNARWLMSLRSIDAYFDLFGIGIEKRHALILQWQSDFEREFNADKVIRTQINDKFRKYRAAIESIMEQHSNIIVSRNSRLESCVRDMYSKGGEDFIVSTLSSYVHMHINRTFSANQRMHEYVIYCLMAKYYQGIQVMKKIR
ncbi:lantibiotic dehydratase [Chitinophaga sp. S165]|uniref:lantibiotic dehydratase n=1 Tax=Chitinophaga sp. S165 TaxID=2135462 RepID=UPI000D95829A|nr:lantibiotic dehydratase [Chitinophaga sp. S165]PWV51819.1 thiopeptide-type bacteriocin biosynthesis protein [Chitinophaga sp. S165]